MGYKEYMSAFRAKLDSTGRKIRADIVSHRKGEMGWYGLIMGGAMAVLGLVVFGLIAAIGVILLVNFQTGSGVNNANVNATIGNATSGIMSVATQLPLIGLVIAFSIILIIVMGAVVAVVGGGLMKRE